jgi:hypothetical protein
VPQVLVGNIIIYGESHYFTFLNLSGALVSRLDDIIEKYASGPAAPEVPPELPDPEKQKLREFFFKEMQAPNRNGWCPKCSKDMRIHLSTFICDECEKYNAIG